MLAIAGVGFCIFLTTKKRRRPTPNPSLQREGRSKPCANNKVLRRVVIPDEQERRVIAVGGSSFLTTKKGIQIANREENLSSAGMPPLLLQPSSSGMPTLLLFRKEQDKANQPARKGLTLSNPSLATIGAQTGVSDTPLYQDSVPRRWHTST